MAVTLASLAHEGRPMLVLTVPCFSVSAVFVPSSLVSAVRCCAVLCKGREPPPGNKSRLAVE
jgi:hypothetical protein